MTDAERLALAKRLYDTYVAARDWHNDYLARLDIDHPTRGAIYGIIDIYSAKVATIEAIFPELMEGE